jgi:hypothetical protein
MLLLIISFLIFVGYIFIMWKYTGMPESISNSYYLLEHKWVFTMFMYSIGILTLPVMLDILSGSNLQFLGFIAGAALLFVGAAPAFKGERVATDRFVHKTAALVAAICVECIMVFVLRYWYIALAGALAIVYPFIKYPKSRTFWLEVGCFIPAYISLIISVLC